MPTKKRTLSSGFRYKREVRTYEVDFQQIVHNAVYFYYFEEARIEYLKNLGFTIKGEINIADSHFVVVHNEADYREPARLGDKLDILVRISELGRSSFTYELSALRDDGIELCSGRTTVVTIDRNTGRPGTIPELLRKAVERFEGAAIDAGTD